MYGFMFKALERLIKSRFGDTIWTAILTDATETDLEHGFKLHEMYPDSLLTKLVRSSITVLEKEKPELQMTANVLLELFGKEFFSWTVEYRYDNLLRILGSTLSDFLANLDALHDHLGTAYSGMQAPSFRCADSGKDVIYLYYYSVREGLYPIVSGIVKAVAREVYHVNISMEVVPEPEDNPDVVGIFPDDSSVASSSAMLSCTSTIDSESLLRKAKPVVFAIHIRQNEETTRPTSVSGRSNNRQRKISVLGSSEDIRLPDQNLISPSVLCRAFPFHMVFDKELLVIQMGVALQRIIYREHKDPIHLDQLFEVVRPRMPFSFNLILNHINGVFILRTKRRAFPHSRAGSIRLKGQMLFDYSHNVMLFLCSPRISSMTQLQRSGLYLSDIPIHDATRDLLLQAQTSVAEFRLMQQMELLLDNLKKAQCDLKREKMLTDRLLYSILPESAANALRQGKAVPVENYDKVTILFSDIKGFTNICGQAQPLQVVRMLHEVYMRFDHLVAAHKVYKVETIGDAYMVVGGLPEMCEDHAQRIACQALDMQAEAKKVLSPHTREPLEIRVGIHSGTVMAGVVGQRMPRYCLFGNNVNIASRTESTGEAGKIHITQSTYNYIKRCREFGFVKRVPMVQMKGVSPDIQTYFLIEQRPDDKKVSVEDCPELTESAFFEEPDLPQVPNERYVCRMCEHECTAPVEGGHDRDLMDSGDDDDFEEYDEVIGFTTDTDNPDGAESCDDIPHLHDGAGARTVPEAAFQPQQCVIHSDPATHVEQDQVVTAVLLDQTPPSSSPCTFATALSKGVQSDGATGLTCPFSGLMLGGESAPAATDAVPPGSADTGATSPRHRPLKRKMAVLSRANVLQHSNFPGMGHYSQLSSFGIEQNFDRKISQNIKSLDLAEQQLQEGPTALPIRLRHRESALCQLVRTYSHENVTQVRKVSNERREMKLVDMHSDQNGNSSAVSAPHNPLVILRPLSPSLSMPSLLEYEGEEFLMYLKRSYKCSEDRTSTSSKPLSVSDDGSVSSHSPLPCELPSVSSSVVDVDLKHLQHFQPVASSSPQISVVDCDATPELVHASKLPTDQDRDEVCKPTSNGATRMPVTTAPATTNSITCHASVVSGTSSKTIDADIASTDCTQRSNVTAVAAKSDDKSSSHTCTSTTTMPAQPSTITATSPTAVPTSTAEVPTSAMAVPASTTAVPMSTGEVPPSTAAVPTSTTAV
eukprot:scpid21713/ scgid8212/ Guanylate cyclase soluble subunit beta-2